MAVGLLALSPWGERLAATLPACHFKALFGIPCLSCGTTRAALALARFELWQALVHYPLATLGWIFLIGGGLVAGVAALAGYGVPALPRRIPWWVRIGIILALLANWAYLIATGA